MAKTLDPHRLEQDARALFLGLDAAVPVAYDAAGRRIEITAGARYAEINRCAWLIAISDALAQAVVDLNLSKCTMRIAALDFGDLHRDRQLPIGEFRWAPTSTR